MIVNVRVSMFARLSRWCRFMVVPGVCVLALSTGARGEADDWPTAPHMGDGAGLSSGRDVIERMIAFMGGHQQLQFKSRATYEAMQDSGQLLSFDLVHRMIVDKPGRLFWKTLNDNAVTDSVWFVDGEFKLFKQPANVWGTIQSFPEIGEAVDELVSEYGIPVPFADLLVSDPEGFWLGESILSVELVGAAYIDGQWTDHVSLRKEGVDLELWVRKGEEPFPVRLTFRLLDEPGKPIHDARFSDWSTTVSADEIPTFSPPPDSEKLELVPSVSQPEGVEG